MAQNVASVGNKRILLELWLGNFTEKYCAIKSMGRGGVKVFIVISMMGAYCGIWSRLVWFILVKFQEELCVYIS